MNERVCLDCAQPGEFGVVTDDGTMHGWLCSTCEDRRRLKQMGWRRRLKRLVRSMLGI
jgi:hypothetical protein